MSDNAELLKRAEAHDFACRERAMTHIAATIRDLAAALRESERQIQESHEGKLHYFDANVEMLADMAKARKDLDESERQLMETTQHLANVNKLLAYAERQLADIRAALAPLAEACGVSESVEPLPAYVQRVADAARERIGNARRVLDERAELVLCSVCRLLIRDVRSALGGKP